MKKIGLLVLSTITLFFSGCFKDKKALEYSDYIDAAMDATYYGDNTRYMDLADSTLQEANDLYDGTIEYLAEAIMEYNSIEIDYIGDEIIDKYKDLAKEALKKTKYTVNEARKVDGIYQVKVEIEPLDIWDATYDEVEDYIEEFGRKYPTYDNMTEEQIIAAEEEYANGVLEILQKYVKDMTYKDAVSKIVEIEYDDDGLYGITDEDWADIDDYVMGIK